ncbi:MAG: A24 family peptidase, partial [Kiloniellales bacterium]|nr:A24 family peptidase [Kiloniellales bacterium]
MAWVVFLLIASPFVGSFLGLLAVRLPIGESVLLGRSRCRACGHVLSWQELIPILSWLWQRGTCRKCGKVLSVFYPLMELASLCVALVTVVILPLDVVPWGVLFGWTLLLLAVIDYRTKLLPDVLTLPLILAGLLFAYYFRPDAFADHLWGAVLGFLVLAGVAHLYRVVRKAEGLGLGDAKLFAAAGAWLSWAALPSVLLLAAGSGLLCIIGLRTFGAK